MNLSKQEKQKFAAGQRKDQKAILELKLEDQLKILKSSQDINLLMAAQGAVRTLEALLSSFDESL